MTDKMVKKADLSELLNRLLEDYRVFAPVRRGDITTFQQISAADEPDFSCTNTILSPKSLMLPQSECLFDFTLEKGSDMAGIMREIDKDYSPRVIFGIRPCDAQSFQLLDLNFDTSPYRDPWWVRRRHHTTLVGLGCNVPCSTCFCTSVGGSPFAEDGLDLLLTDVGEEFALQAITEKGEQLLRRTGIDTEPSAATAKAVLACKESALGLMRSSVPTNNLEKHDATALFNADFWDKVQFACINCGICTYVCPTCWCFDIQDEVRKNNGVRLRNWDSCMSPLFTLHGSGHNPRNEKLQRVRQRFMHKLKYFVDKYERGVACVGCGRCVEQCPVNIDIREVVRLMNQFKV